MIDVWVNLLGGLAVGGGVKFVSNFAPTDWTDCSGKLKNLFQFGSMKNSNALVEHEKMEVKVQVHCIEERALSTATDTRRTAPACCSRSLSTLSGVW
jgi:hypothetical protein